MPFALNTGVFSYSDNLHLSPIPIISSSHCRLTELVKLLATVLETLAMVNERILHGALWLVTGCKDPASYEAKVVTVYAAGQHTDRFRVQTSVTKSVNLTA